MELFWIKGYSKHQSQRNRYWNGETRQRYGNGFKHIRVDPIKKSQYKKKIGTSHGKNILKKLLILHIHT